MSDYQLRFAGIARLYGVAALEKFRQAHVCVIGIGGVGSWAAEALARTLSLIMVAMAAAPPSNSCCSSSRRFMAASSVRSRLPVFQCLLAG